jgi:hypothetical protein
MPYPKDEQPLSTRKGNEKGVKWKNRNAPKRDSSFLPIR